MTSFAGIKSSNSCGRRGVNSSTALRTAAGSKEDIRRDVVDVNRETDRRQNVHGDAVHWTIPCLIRFEDKVGLWLDYGHGKFGDAVCLQRILFRCCSRFAAG